MFEHQRVSVSLVFLPHSTRTTAEISPQTKPPPTKLHVVTRISHDPTGYISIGVPDAIF